jgi:multiple sugar transport system substrate-binding protein
MKINHKSLRVMVTAIAAMAIMLSVSACSTTPSNPPSTNSTENAPGTSITSGLQLSLWDPYPQFDQTSDWAKTLDSCAQQQGDTITRDSMDQSSLVSKLLLAASQKNAPDIAIVDNPMVASVAETGLLATNSQLGLDTSQMLPNILAAGDYNGQAYGVPVGSNTLALFYNKTILAALNLQPPTNWDELKSDVAAAQAKGYDGIGFSAVGTEEGTFQFLPFFWGAGANLMTLNSPEAVQALTLWTDLVKSGGASADVLNDTQADINDKFLAGNLLFQVNGSWQLAGLDKGSVQYGVVPVPAINGGSAPVPLGGEFFTIPANTDTAKQQAAVKIVQCMTDPTNAQNWIAGLTYVLPEKSAQDQQAASDPELAPFIAAIATAQGRTSDLGTNYPKYSEQLWTAVQAALSGTKTPQQALDAAQAAVAS